MRTKSFILTFLMMMFCSVSFGQNTNPDWGEFNYHDYAMNMEVIAKISLDGEAQTSTSIQVAAYCGNERRSEVMMIKQTPGGSLVQLQVFGVKGFPTDPDQTQTTEKITFKFYDGTSMFVSNEDMDFKGNHVVGDLFNPFTIEFKSVAKIGDVKYGSLDAAINAAQANNVIVLLADVVAETNPVNIPANVTLDLNDNTIKADIFGTVKTNKGLWITSDGYKMIGEDADIYASNNATVVNTLVNNVNTITIAYGNVTLAATQYNEWWTAQGQELIIGENAIFTIPQGKKFNIEPNTSVTINGTVNNEGTLAIKNDATVKGNITGDIHFLGGKYITADNYKMVGTTSDYYYNTTDALVNIAGQFGDITIKSGEMTLGQSWRTVQGQTLTIASGAEFTVPANMTFEVFQNTHVIVNGTLVTDGTVYLQLNATVKAAEGLNIKTKEENAVVVYSEGVYKVEAAEAKIGDTYYRTLAEAVEAATVDQIVELIADATGTGLVINKNITVDFGGKTYTINQAVGSSGTESQGFQLLKEATEVTLQNGTVEVKDGAHVVWMINDYSAKLNVTNVIFNCEHMDLPNNGDASNVYFLVANNAHNQNPAVTLTDVEVKNFDSDFGSPYFMEPNTTIKSADANLDIEVDPGYRLVYDATQQTYSVEKLIAHFDGGAYAAYAANKPREHFSINLYDVYASQSLVVKVYHNETLLLTTTYRAEDLDAPGVNRYPVSAERLTVNNVVSGKVAGSWDNTYAEGIRLDITNVPNMFEVYVDDILTDTYDGTEKPNAGFSSAENLKTYLGFTGVYKAASVTRGTDVTYYMTLAEAWNATQDGDIVTLYDNAELASRLDVTNKITLNLNAKNITANFEDQFGAIYVKKGAELTIEGEGDITSNSSVAIGTYGTVNIKGGNITSGEGYAALYVFYYPNHSEGTANISGGRLNVVWNCGNLNVSNGLIDYLDTSSELNVTGGVITKMLAKDGSDASGAYEMNIQNIETTVPTVEVPEHFKFVEISENVYQVVAKVYIAQTETGAQFETLQEAIDAANETVTLLQTTTGAGAKINKDITIDFGGNTYTVNQAVGSAGTETLGFQILKDNDVTLKNGTLTSTTPVVAGKEVKMLIQNYADLTLTDMNLVDNTDHILYALSNNSGNVILDGNTNITTDKVAFDVCKYASYTEPIVNVNTTGVIAGDIEVTTTEQTNLNISGGLFTVEIEEAWCADGYIPTQTEDGKWTVKLGEYVARVNGQGYETFDAALAADGEVIVIKPIVITEDKEYNFTNEKITGDNVYPIFRIQNGATMIVTGGEVTNPTDYVFVLGASDGSSHGDLIINGGKYHGATTVASVTLGALTITGGEFSVEPYEGNYAFLINCIDANYKNGTASVAITGGTFHNWNPQNNAAEGTGTNFCYDKYAATETAENVWTVLPAVAKIGETYYATLQDAVNAADATNNTINLIANVQLTAFVTIDKSVNLNLGQFDITRNDGTALYVNGENIQVAIYGTGKVSGYQAVFVNNGIVTINGGNFVGNPEAVYVINNGHAVINGGRFETIDSDKRYVLNEYDATRDVTTINVYGGTFVGFDPENNAAEGAGTNFCAEGYISDDNGDGTFTVRRGEYVAQIAETGAKYETLQAAYEAANANHTIVLLQNVTLDATFAIAKGVTLNGSENNYKLTVNANGIPAVKVNTNDDVIFKNLVIESTGYNNGSQTHGVHIAKKANVTFDNVDVNSVYSVFVESSAAESVINVNNGSKLYADMSGIYAKGKVTINVTNSWVEKYYNGGSAIYVNGEYSVVNVVNSTIKATSTSNAHFAAFEIGADNVTVNVDENSKIEVINSSYDIYAFYVGDKELNNRVLTNHNIIIADGATINKNKETDPVIYIKDAEVKVTKDNVATMMYFRLIDALAVSHVEGETMTILKPVVLTENAALNIEGRTIITAENVYPAIRVQNDAEVTITGEGTIKNDDYVFVVGASDASSAGNLTIENGTYVGETTVAQVTLGKLNITGGDFSITDVETYDYAYLINCKDEYYNAGTAQVEIKGGTFHNFNPQNNAAEGAGTNFCAEGYGAYESAPNVWTVRGAVARIGDRYFAKVADATSAAVTGDIVYLLDNVNDAEVTVDLNTAKKITIDLGDFTYTSTGTAFIAYRNGTELTITNGTVNGNGAAGGTLRATYNATLILGADLTVNAGPQATAIVIQDGKFFVNPNTENVIVNGGIDCIKVQEGALEVSIASGTYTEDVQEWCAQGYVSQYNGNGTWTVVKADYVAEIVGGAKYESLQAAIDAAVDGQTVTLLKDINYTFEDTKTTPEGQPILVDVTGKYITLDFAGKKISVNHQSTTDRIYAVVFVADGAGLTVTGNGFIDVDVNDNTPKVAYMFWKRGTTGHLTIENGNFHMDNSEDSMVYTNGDEIVTVNGGTFTLDMVGTRANGFPCIFNATGQNAQKIIVKGGTFNADVNHQFWANEVYVPETLALQNNGDETWTVVDAVAYVTEIATSTDATNRQVGYATLAEAVIGNSVDDVVTVIKSHVLAETVIVNKNVNIDFATGVELTTKAHPTAFRITEGADVTVVNANIKTVEGGLYNFILGASDSSSEGKLTIKNGTFVANTTVASVTKGNLVIEGGDFSLVEGTTDYRYLINCIDANYNNETATVAISGGTFHNWNPQDNAAETGGHANFCAEGYAAVETSTGVWEVVPMQEMKLYAGWNWFSSYIDINGEAGLGRLQEALNPNGVQIKNDGGFTQYTEGQGWFGPNLTSASVKEMYMINMSADHNLQLKGELVDPDKNAITLEHGWNWIGYQLNIGLNLENALAGFNPNHGDRIKSHQGFSQYYDNASYKGWWGTLETMTPGYGYMYYNANEDDATLEYSYPADGSKSEVRANITSENNYWVPASSRYAGNMNIVAMLEADGDNYEIAAFVGGEVRGSARPIYVEPLDAYMFFLTVHGEDVEEMSFRVYDLATGEEYNLNDRMNYTDNAIVGSITEPYIFRGTVGVGETSLSEINVYPNPTTIGTEINLGTVCDTVEVFNALGVKVAEYQNVDTVDALETAGIYVIRITNNGNVQNCRLIVK